MSITNCISSAIIYYKILISNIKPIDNGLPNLTENSINSSFKTLNSDSSIIFILSFSLSNNCSQLP